MLESAQADFQFFGFVLHQIRIVNNLLACVADELKPRPATTEASNLSFIMILAFLVNHGCLFRISHCGTCSRDQCYVIFRKHEKRLAQTNKF